MDSDERLAPESAFLECTARRNTDARTSNSNIGGGEGMTTRFIDSCRGGARKRRLQGVFALAVLVAQAACVTTTPGGPRGTPGHYGYGSALVSIDSPSVTCRTNFSACVALYGKEMASATAVVKVVLDATARQSIERELEKCADLARSEVLLRHEGQFEKLSPNAEECKQMTISPGGRRVSWAMRLGEEMHEEARKCADLALSSLRPGSYSLEQRYHYDRATGRIRLVSAEEEQLLLQTGNGGELKGTLKPDVVIHSGNPLYVQATYDFKFPCVNIDRISSWPRYSADHPYAGSTQGELYQEAFGQEPARVVPRLGVIR